MQIRLKVTKKRLIEKSLLFVEINDLCLFNSGIFKPLIKNDMSKAQELVISQTVVKEQKRLFNFIRKRVSSQLDAEDILQDVFFQLARVSGEFNNIEKISAWLFQVARNKITDLYRKKKSIPFSQIGTAEQEDSEFSNSFESSILDFKALPDELLERENLAELIKNCLKELPEDQRKVFEMHEYEGLSFKEISAELGESVNTLISRKRYAVVQLRKKLIHEYEQLKSA